MRALALSSRITGVTVYNQGALIFREALLDGPDLPASVRLTGLPLAIDDHSLRVRVRSIEEGETPPRACDLRVMLDIPDRDGSLQPADNDALENAERRVSAAQLAVELCNERISRLQRVTLLARPEGAEGSPPQRSPVDARLELLGWVSERSDTLDEALSAATEELRRAREAFDEQRELERRRTGARQAREHELRKTVVVSLRATPGGVARGRLLLEYSVPGARWAPAYTVRIDGDTARVSMRAQVAQRTGEDWDDVALTLSTADPLSWCERVELDSIRIGRQQPQKRSGWRPPPRDTGALFADYDRFRRARASLPHPKSVPAPEHPPLAPAAAAPAESAAFHQVEEAEPGDDLVAHAAQAPKTRASMFRSGRARVDEGSLFEVDDGTGVAMAPAGGAMGGVFAQSAQTPADRREVAPAAAPAVTAHTSMLNYGALRLAGPGHSAGREGLAVAPRAALYLELLTMQRVAVRFDIEGLLQRSRAEAARVLSTPAPGGCVTDHAHRYAYTYVSDVTATVASDGEFHGVGVTTGSARVTLRYVVVPRESTDVFRVAEVNNPLGGPLLPGPADVYLRSDFLLTTPVTFTAPEETVRLGLGVEQAVKVVRNTEFSEESAGLLGGATLLNHAIRIAADNHLQREVTLEVRERLPFADEPSDDDISVKVSAAEPAWQQWTAADMERAGHPVVHNAYRWFIDLGPGDRRELSADYAVKISAKHELVGGNRREG